MKGNWNQLTTALPALVALLGIAVVVGALGIIRAFGNLRRLPGDVPGVRWKAAAGMALSALGYAAGMMAGMGATQALVMR
jgi:hypothetical protein